MLEGNIIQETKKYYLVNDYQIEEKKYYWTQSLLGFIYGYHDYAVHVDYNGEMFYGHDIVNYNFSFRPVVQLKSDVSILDGIGTKTNPYVIEN